MFASYVIRNHRTREMTDSKTIGVQGLQGLQRKYSVPGNEYSNMCIPCGASNKKGYWQGLLIG